MKKLKLFTYLTLFFPAFSLADAEGGFELKEEFTHILSGAASWLWYLLIFILIATVFSAVYFFRKKKRKKE